jgi:hypothetical protein
MAAASLVTTIEIPVSLNFAHLAAVASAILTHASRSSPTAIEMCLSIMRAIRWIDGNAATNVWPQSAEAGLLKDGVAC